jgi:hypothetical protein
MVSSEQLRPIMILPLSFPLIWTGVGMKVPSAIEQRDSPASATSGFADIQT